MSEKVKTKLQRWKFAAWSARMLTFSSVEASYFFGLEHLFDLGLRHES